MSAIVAHPVISLRHWAHEKPDAVFLHQPDLARSWSWRETADEVARMASAIAALGFAPGSRIAITGRNSAHWVMADLAIEMAGHVSVGLYPKQSTDSVRYILEHAEVKAVFVGPMAEPAPVLAGIPQDAVRIRLPYTEVAAEPLNWDALVAAHAPYTGYQTPAPRALRTLVYTSGTTGNPKGVMLSFDAGLWCGADALKVLPLGDDEVYFSYMPLAHIFERGSIEGSALGCGGRIHFMDELSRFGQRLRETQPTRFCAVPLIWSRLQAAVRAQLPPGSPVSALPETAKRALLEGLGLARCRFANSGAAPLAPSLITWFGELGLTLYQGYGMTENLAYATCNRPDANRPGSVGQAFPGVELRIAEDGEILTRHPGQMQGYFKDAERTAQSFSDGWLHTGDLGRVDEDGYLYITGRIKDQFKTAKGHFVMPVTMENALAASALIANCCVIGSGLKGAAALISLNETARGEPREKIESELLKRIEQINAGQGPQERIEAVLVVRETWSIDNGLLTPTLKIKRSEIERLYSAAAEAALASRQALIWQ